MYHCRTSPKKGLLTIHLSGWCHWNAPWFLTDTEGGPSSSQGTAFHLPSLPRTHQTWQIHALSYKCPHFLLPGLQLCNTEDEIIAYSMSCREVLAVTAANERSPHLPSLLRKASHGRVPSNRAWAAAFSQNEQPGVQAAKNNLGSKLPRASPCLYHSAETVGAHAANVLGMMGSRSDAECEVWQEQPCGWGDWILLPQS